MRLRESLYTWAALRRGAAKPRTQKYHLEISETICRLWPERADVDTVEITEGDLGAFVIRIDHYSPSRFNGMVTMLQGVLPAAKKIKRRRIRVKRRKALSQLEFHQLLDALDQRPRSHAGLVVRFLAHTGLRINEARQLRWEDVRSDHILVPPEIVKNDQPKAIPFVNGIRITLRKLREVAGESDLVIPQAECKRSLDTACRLAGLPHLSHHDFRHLFATRCIQSGVDIPTVARWLGHQDGGALLAKVYYHLIDEHSRRMAAKVVI